MASNSAARTIELQGLVQSVITAEGWTFPVGWPNAPIEKPARGLWMRVSILEDDAEQTSIGERPTFRLSGELSIQLFDDVENGEGNIRAIEDKLIDALGASSHSETVTRTPRSVRVGRIDGWYQRNVIVPFISDWCKE